MNTQSTETDPFSSGIDFPCGRRAHNRLAKVHVSELALSTEALNFPDQAALYEALSSWGGGAPNDELFGLYHLWAQGQWGIVITGILTLLSLYGKASSLMLNGCQ